MYSAAIFSYSYSFCIAFIGFDKHTKISVHLKYKPSFNCQKTVKTTILTDTK